MANKKLEIEDVVYASTDSNGNPLAGINLRVVQVAKTYAKLSNGIVLKRKSNNGHWTKVNPVRPHPKQFLKRDENTAI